MNLPARLSRYRRLFGKTISVIVSSCLGLSVTLAQTDDQTGISINKVIANGQGVVVRGASPADIESAGDVNNDGFPDFIIGDLSFNAVNNERPTGGAYVIFGGPSFRSDIDVTRLDGRNGFVIKGINPGDAAGLIVSGIGDFNGDGVDDIVMNAPSHDNNQGRGISTGEVYVLYGRSTFPAIVNLSELDGASGLRINNSQGSAGFTVSHAGDINNDGVDDLLLNKQTDIYIVYGNRGLPGYLDLDGLDETNSVVISPVNDRGTIDFLGGKVSTIGDINNDGVDDLVLPSRFSFYVIFGSPRLPARLALEALDGTNGFVIPTGLGSKSTAGAGDVNNDGIDDFMVTLWASSPDGVNQAGASFLIYGQSSFERSLDLKTLDGRNGVEFRSQVELELSGISVDSAGDVNKDGFNDLIIGAPTTQGAPIPGSEFGSAYVIFGQPTFDSPTILTTLDSAMGFRIDDPLQGRDFSNTVSGLGDINADGIDDFAILTRTDFYPGVAYVVFGRADWIGDNTPPTRSCGKPSFDGTVDRGIFLWQECPGGTPNGDWNLLAGAGGSAKHLRFNGVIETESLQAILNRVEPSDSLQSGSDSAAFQLFVVNNWIDGMTFSTNVNASVCTDITLNDRNAPVYLGANRQQLDTRTAVDLNTGEPCTLSPRQAICGRPTFNGTAGLYIWQICGTNSWRLAAVSDRGRYRFNGAMKIDNGVSVVRPIRFEANDALEVLSPDSFRFDMHVSGSGNDAVSFDANRYDAQSACLSLSSLSTPASVFVGRHNVERALERRSLDLFSLQPCLINNPAS